jgi:hypothetical protein
MVVDRHAPMIVLGPAGGEVELVYIGNSAGAVDDAIGFRRVLVAAM